MKTNARLNWTLVAVAGVFGLTGILVAGGGGSGRGSDLPMTIEPNDPRLLPPEKRVSRALFEALHERTVESFSKRVGFGRSRMVAPAEDHIGADALWTIVPPKSAGYEVALIGLESDPKGVVYSIERGEDEGKEQPAASIGQVLEGDLPLLVTQSAPRPVDKQPASDLDRKMLDLLEKNGEAPMLVDESGERVMMYGGIHATQQRCIACHECEPGTLLGAFRYVFEIPADDDDKVVSR
jgi:hypothetical protein